MSKEPRALARRGAQALTAAVMVVGGISVAGPAHAVLPLPTISGVVVAGSTTNKVVGAGTTVVITGTGFTGMTDNAASGGCSIAPAAYPDAGSGCSQVRFVGAAATANTGYTLATRYNVVSDTKIYATVPSITIGADATVAGQPAAGTGSIRVQVVNTMGTGTSSGVSASTASEIFYRGALTANYSGAVAANPYGGGTLVVPVTGVANLTSTTFPLEKITGYIYSTVANSPQVSPTAVTFNDATNVNVVLPPGTPAGNNVGIMLVHDGITGTADTDSLTYPALITKVESCSASVDSWATTPTSTLPTCTGTANVSGATADVKITGKGMTGATVWDFTGGDNNANVTYNCRVVSDTLAYCHLTITQAPASGVAAVKFTPVAQGSATAATLVPTGGSILIYNELL